MTSQVPISCTAFRGYVLKGRLTPSVTSERICRLFGNQNNTRSDTQRDGAGLRGHQRTT